MSTNNIQSPRGIQAPSLQAASSKQDGGGNGEGGMYFGQEPQDESYTYNTNPFYYDSVDTGDMTFSVPLFGTVPASMGAWKTAIAISLYQDMSKRSHS